MVASPTVIFNWKGQNRVWLHVSKGETKEDQTLSARIRKNYGPSIEFRRTGTESKPESQFRTDDPDLIKYIRLNKKAKGIIEDLSLIPIGCPYCDWRADGNSQEHQEELAIHLTECKGLPGAINASGDS
jgi:hypothetical protein